MSLILSIVFVCTTACLHAQSDARYIYESEVLKIDSLHPQVYRHVSYLQTEDYGKVACNGVVYVVGGEAIVVDTPTDDNGSRALLDWLNKSKAAKIKSVVVSHFHEDCLGGLRYFHDNGAVSYGNIMTADILKQDSSEVQIQNTFVDSLTLEIGNGLLKCVYPGEGHTLDNIVCYFEEAACLFGGCLIKSLNSGKGFLGDANVGSWSETVQEVAKRFPGAEIIIPGHGKVGDRRLLQYTIEMFDPN